METVDIAPGVSVLSVFRHLNYHSWYALAEFVDNALQSALDNRDALQNLTPEERYECTVEIDLDSVSGEITIKDNAAGIAEKDFPRALRTAQPPPDRAGLSEFGVGMKSAAFWFAPRWSLCTTALGDRVQRCVDFDLQEIVSEERSRLTVQVAPASHNSHGTIIQLRSVYRVPTKRTLGKIREHLRSIYRMFLREGLLRLRIGNEWLSPEIVPVLVAPYFRSPDGPKLEWRRPFIFEFGPNMIAEGWAALRATASTKEAGFGLFRRSRLILGSGEDTYRPVEIFGRSNSYAYQRLFGEISIEGLDVTHTKDGFQWGEYEQAFLEKLHRELDEASLPLLSQAEGYRVRPRETDVGSVLDKAVIALGESLTAASLESASEANDSSESGGRTLPISHDEEVPGERLVEFMHEGTTYRIRFVFSTGPWARLYDVRFGSDDEVTEIVVALMHPFVQRHQRADYSGLAPMVEIIGAITVGEIMARLAGATNPGAIRRTLNALLSGAP